MAIARAAEDSFAQKVSWGARCGDVAVIFTTASVPVMTRLRLSERRVLDTLIDAGVARSRSEALAWCVRLVGEKEEEWIHELRGAFAAVEAARAKGPKARRPPAERLPGEGAAAGRQGARRERAGADQQRGAEPAAANQGGGDAAVAGRPEAAGDRAPGDRAAGDQAAGDRAAGDQAPGGQAACD